MSGCLDSACRALARALVGVPFASVFNCSLPQLLSGLCRKQRVLGLGVDSLGVPLGAQEGELG
jgi:hypothetical protein